MDQKEYWDKKIKVWSDSTYTEKPKKIGLVERVAKSFRSPVVNRRAALLQYLTDDLSVKTVLDLGCGNGNLSLAILATGAKKVIGLDISPSITTDNKEMAKKTGKEGKLEFICGDVREMAVLPASDLVVGLGFIDYLNLDELVALLNKVGDRSFIFSFPEKKFSLINILQYFYLKSQGCPGFFKFRKRDVDKISGRQWKYPSISGLVFISNF